MPTIDIPQSLINELARSTSAPDTVTHPRQPLDDARDAGMPVALAPANVRGTLPDVVGAFSVQKFVNQGALSHTHADARGFLAGPFGVARNFWYGDAGVQPWAYYEEFDNWQDDYGMDAVLVAYHSGHGGMAADGNFVAPLGAVWNGTSDAWGFNMRLGNERARYLFWSTCFSLRVLEGHNPIRSWNLANLGWRMMFGYETVSFDNPNYGSAFWKHWRAGKSFSTAWLDASWYDISHNQAPSACAVGANAAEARDRLYNERVFQWGAAAKNWWEWRWYNASTRAASRRATSLRVPAALRAAILEPARTGEARAQQILERHDLRLSDEVRAGAAGLGADQAFATRRGDLRASFAPDGSYDLDLAAPNLENRTALPMRDAVGIAATVVQRGPETFGLTLDRVLHKYGAGGTEDGDGHLDEPRIVETVVQFTQLVDGVPVLLPGNGGVTVTIDNDGTVTSIRDTTRSVAELSDRPLIGRAGPPDPSGTAARGPRSGDPERLLADAFQEQLRSWVVGGRMPVSYADVPGSAEVGFAIADDEAHLVARKEVEVDLGGGFLKRYALEVPIAE